MREEEEKTKRVGEMQRVNAEKKKPIEKTEGGNNKTREKG